MKLKAQSNAKSKDRRPERSTTDTHRPNCSKKTTNTSRYVGWKLLLSQRLRAWQLQQSTDRLACKSRPVRSLHKVWTSIRQSEVSSQERMAQLPRRLDDCHAHASVILVIGGALAHGLLLSQALENGVQMPQKGARRNG